MLSEAAVTQRHIPMDGTPNFRDLGGYETRCSRRVRFGKLFRSGALSQLSEQDIERFVALNIVTVCDFRRGEETERDPSSLPDQPRPKIVHLPINPGSRTAFFEHLSETGGMDDKARQLDMAEFMVHINRDFALEHHDSFKQMLVHIDELSAKQSLLFHCAAGKDRTGFAAALILMCLNVPRETIIEDYMLTAEYFDPEKEISRLAKKYVDFGFDRIDPAIIRPMLEVREEYICEAFDAIDEHFASDEEYLAKVFGLDASDLKRFQSNLLE